MRYRTQIEAAQNGETTPEMEAVAAREGLAAEEIRTLVAAGHAVIPANRHHTHLQPVGIGRKLRTKINANIGTSALSSDAALEEAKLDFSLSAGADTVMDLSTGPGSDELRAALIARSSLPLGTVPMYEAAAQVEQAEDLTPEALLAAVEHQAQQGVDYMTIHAGLMKAHLPLAKKRLLGIVSRGGGLLARWMAVRGEENPMFTRFNDILDICLTHDVTLSLGDGLRPGCLADASDAAQFAELEALGKLVQRCRKAGVQAMVEGPGHIPLNEIEMNMRRERELCDDAPFYVLGPVVADCGAGRDHITAAIGGAFAAMHGAAMLCYVTPKEHLGLPNPRDVREGVAVFKLAAHAADTALRKPFARERDDAISKARAAFNWEEQFRWALDPDRARELRKESLAERATATCSGASGPGDESYCTMCGPKFCPMRLNRDLL